MTAMVHPAGAGKTIIRSSKSLRKGIPLIDGLPHPVTQVDDEQIQPNAIDLRISRIFKINYDGNPVVLTESEKKHADKFELFVSRLAGEGNNKVACWYLEPATYEVLFDETIAVHPNEAGWVITRSTLNRNGIFLTSGLYDSGYNGVMAAALHVSTVPLIIAPGTRIGQYLAFSAESKREYDGDYGAGSSHDAKAYGSA